MSSIRKSDFHDSAEGIPLNKDHINVKEVKPDFTPAVLYKIKKLAKQYAKKNRPIEPITWEVLKKEYPHEMNFSIVPPKGLFDKKESEVTEHIFYSLSLHPKTGSLTQIRFHFHQIIDFVIKFLSLKKYKNGIYGYNHKINKFERSFDFTKMVLWTNRDINIFIYGFFTLCFNDVLSKYVSIHKFQKEIMSGLNQSYIKEEDRLNIANKTNYLNCFIDWKDRKIYSHVDKELIFLNKLDIKCPHIDVIPNDSIGPDKYPFIQSQVFDKIFPYRPGIHKFIKQYIGMMVVNPNKWSPMILVFVGSGGNGKSFLCQVIERTIGPHNCSHLTPKDLVKEQKLKDLVGKKVNICEETNNKDFNSHLTAIKNLSAGGITTARYLYNDSFEFRNEASFTFSFNHAPKLDNIPALTRRVRIIPFTQTFKNTTDIDLEIIWSKVDKESFHFINHCVQEYEQGIKNNDLFNSSEIDIATKNIIKKDDPVIDFCKEHLKIMVIPVPHRLTISNLFTYYNNTFIRGGRYASNPNEVKTILKSEFTTRVFKYFNEVNPKFTEDEFIRNDTFPFLEIKKVDMINQSFYPDKNKGGQYASSNFR